MAFASGTLRYIPVWVRSQCFYLRVRAEYWSNGSNLGLTPLVLAQYGGYLGVIADGQDPANQAAGPHTTIT